MASFYAELRVDGHVIPVLLCTYGVHQGTGPRGRVSTRVRYAPVRLRFKVGAWADFLRHWGFSPHKRYQVDIVFFAAAGGSALETLHLAGAYCVYYGEEFIEGDITFGSYVCELTLTDPDGFTMQAGGPGTFVTPAARDHGGPVLGSGVPSPTLVPDIALTARPFLKNDADPLYDVLGPGRLSHPQEWKETIDLLKKEGVDVVLRDGVMAYGPQPRPGKPGRLIIDPNASIGALRHETQHFLDGKVLGFPGMSGLFDPKTRWQMEYNAYMREVRLARDLRAFKTGVQLVSNARVEKQFIAKNYGPVK